MILLTTKGWPDYELLDSGNGLRLERFGAYTLVRPDPQCIWHPSLPQSEWSKAHAIYIKGQRDTGTWKEKQKLPEKWPMKYKNIAFYCKLTPFKHTGIFPEQAAQWDWIADKLDTRPGAKVLNLFGYTGLASLVAAAHGAQVTHVDASYPTIGWGRENQKLSGLENKPIRWILDDAVKFCQREIKRGKTYDGILMDPPIYGHGPNGEKWDFYESFPQLMSICKQILTPSPLFVLVNAYAISASAIMLENVLNDFLKTGTTECGEIALQETTSERLLSTGIFARWSM